MHIRHFANSFKYINTEKVAESLLSLYLNSFGFTHFAFTYYSLHVKSGRKLRYHFVSKALLPWHAHYLGQAYADVDRTLEENHLITLPLFWDVHAQLAQAKSKREARIRQESIEFGIDKGLSLPVYGPNHDFVSLTLHQCVNETCLQNYELQQFEWLSATQIYYHHIRKILALKKTIIPPLQLTHREKQCLMLTGKAWRVEQIAKELQISSRTVNFHIQNANKKLGTNNKYQAIYKYMQLIENE